MKELTDIKKAIYLYRIGGEGFVVDKGGGITVGFKITYPEYHNINFSDIYLDATATDESGDSRRAGLNLVTTLQLAIKDLPDNYVFHQQDWQWFAPPADIPNNHNYLNNATRKMYGDQKLFAHAGYIFISKKSGIFKDSDFTTRGVQEFIEQVENFQSKITNLCPQRMSEEDWLHYLESVFALDHTQGNEKELYDIDFEAQKFGDYNMSGYAVNGDKTIGELSYFMLNPDRSSPSSERYNAWTHPLTWGINVPKVVNNVVVRMPASQLKSEVANFESQISLFSKLMAGAVRQAQEYKAIVDEGKATPVLHHFSVFYFLPPRNSEETERKIRAAFSKLTLKPTRITVDLGDSFLGTIGGCATSLKFPQHLYPAFLDEAVCFSNLEGSYAQNSNGIVFADPMGQPVVKDLFFGPYDQKIITNWNVNIIGPSGTGKSVLTNYILSTTYFMDFFFVIIDIGGSYEGLCKLLKGKYIKLDTEGKSLSTNPFLISMVDPTTPEGYAAVEDELTSLMAIIFIAWDTDLSLKVENQNSRAILEGLLLSFFKKRYEDKREYVCFDDFYALVEEEEKKKQLEHNFFDAASFLLVMKKFSKRKGGTLGFLFNGVQNLNDFSGYRMIVFELESISENPILFRLVTSMITMLTNRIIQRAKARMRQVWMDECWRMLLDPHFGTFIKMLSKTVRKKDGGITVIVQELDDILKSEHGEAIINNAGTFMALSHEGKEQGVIKHKKALNFTDDQLSLLLSMKIKDRTVFIKQGSTCGVYGIKISPEHYALFTSTRKEKEGLQRLIAQHEGNITMAVEEFVENDMGAVKRPKRS
ncbi:MAG: hypothetical protein LBK47_08045 [Prevotellaceae bacterium]|jgi:hypothetical protein|nr:hypothetical protein [Prevotellaceae bacterium]